MLKNLYSNVILSYPKLALGFTILIVALLASQIYKFEIDFSSETLLLQDDKDLAFAREVNKRYYSPDYLVVTYTPNKGLLENETLESIANLTKDFKELESVEDVTSILSVPLLQSEKKPLKELIENIPTLEQVSDKSVIEKELLNSPLYSNNLVSADFKTTAMLIYLKDDTKYFELLEKRNALVGVDTLEAKEANRAFKEYRDSIRDKNHQIIMKIRNIMHNYQDSGKLFLGGINMITDDMISFIKYDLEVYGTIVLAILIVILWIIFRQVRYVLMSVLISLLSIISTTGFLSLFGFEVTVISSNFITIQLIITMSLTIHLNVKYRELLQKYPDATQEDLVLNTVLSMSKPSFFVILTTMVGFGSLITSGILPVINLGLMMSGGLFLSLFLTFLIFPTIMVQFKKIPPQTFFETHFLLTKHIANMVKNHSKYIIIASVFAFIFGGYGVTKLIVENSFINYFKSNTEIYKGMETIDRYLGGTTPLDIVVNLNTNQISIEEKSEDVDSFEDEFSQNENEAKYWFTAQKMQTIEKIHDYLDSRDEVGKVLSLATILKIGRELNNGKDLDNFELALLYEKLPEEYKKIILYPYLSINDNQVRFSTRIIDSKEGLRRGEMLASIQKDLENELKLEDFKLSGMMVLYNNMLQSLFNSQIKTLGIVVFILGVVFLLLFKSFKIGLIAMIVNMIPITMVFGVMGVAQIPLDIMTITIAAISFGMAVDNTIHYLHRFKSEIAKDSDYVAVMYKSHNSIGYAMYYTSFVVMLGFSILMLSNFIPTIYFGLLVALAMFFAVLGDLVLLPTLLILFKPFSQKEKEVEKI